MGNFLIGLGIAVILLLAVLAYIYYRDAKAEKAEAKELAALYRAERLKNGAWDGAERRRAPIPERDMQLFAHEREAARSTATEKSVNVVHADGEEHELPALNIHFDD